MAQSPEFPVVPLPPVLEAVEPLVDEDEEVIPPLEEPVVLVVAAELEPLEEEAEVDPAVVLDAAALDVEVEPAALAVVELVPLDPWVVPDAVEATCDPVEPPIDEALPGEVGLDPHPSIAATATVAAKLIQVILCMGILAGADPSPVAAPLS